MVVDGREQHSAALAVQLAGTRGGHVRHGTGPTEHDVASCLILLSLRAPVRITRSIGPLLVRLGHVNGGLGRVATGVGTNTFQSCGFRSVVSKRGVVCRRLLDVTEGMW